MADKTPKGGWSKEADSWFSKYVRARDVTCQAAGRDGRDCKGVLQCCHIITRAEKAISTNPWNAIAMCQSHHMYYTANPHDWRIFIDEEYPGRWDELYQRVQDHRAAKRKVNWREQAMYWKNAYLELI